MNKSELEQRTKRFAVAVIFFMEKALATPVSRILLPQLLDSATSIGANYGEANRAESRRDFVHKIAISEKEAAESLYWLELLEEVNIGNPIERKKLFTECNELLAIFTSIGKSTKAAPKSEIRNPKSEIE